MPAMDALFRLNDTTPHDASIDTWLDEREPALGAIASQWFATMRACGPDVRETMHDGCPTACVKDAAFAYVNVFKAHVNVGFFRGSELDDPTRLLEGSGKRMRHVKLRPGVEIDSEGLTTLITAAYSDIKRRLASE